MMNHVNMVVIDPDENAVVFCMAMLAPITFRHKMQKTKKFDVLSIAGALSQSAHRVRILWDHLRVQHGCNH